MSHWTTLKVNARVKKPKQISIKDIIDEICDDNVTDITSEDLGKYYGITLEAHIRKELTYTMPQVQKELLPHLEKGAVVEISGRLPL